MARGPCDLSDSIFPVLGHGKIGQELLHPSIDRFSIFIVATRTSPARLLNRPVIGVDDLGEPGSRTQAIIAKLH